VKARIDSTTRAIQHDAAGEVVVDGASHYVFDPRGQLAAITRHGQLVEGYFSDAQGRLAGTTHSSASSPDQVFAYDGLQMVAAFDATDQPIWEATWGPGTDRLLSWRDRANGGDEQIR